MKLGAMIGAVAVSCGGLFSLAQPASASTAPASYTPFTQVQSYGAYGNDSGENDCQSAAVGDLIQTWNAEIGRSSTPVPMRAILNLYGHVRPFLGNAGLGGNIARYLERNPVAGVRATSYRSIAPAGRYGLFSSAQRASIERAIVQYGGVYGEAFVPSDVPSDGPWTLQNSHLASGTFGHAFAIVGYSPSYIYAVMWGVVTPITWQWWDSYGSAIYVIGHRAA